MKKIVLIFSALVVLIGMLLVSYNWYIGPLSSSILDDGRPEEYVRADMQSLATQIAEKQMGLSALENSLATNPDAAESIQAEIDDLRGQITDLENQISDLQNVLDNRAAGILAQQEYFAEQERKFEEQIAPIQADIAKYTAEKASLESAIASEQARLVQTEASVAGQQAAYNVALENVAQLENQIAPIQAEITKIDAQIALIEKEIKAINGRLSANLRIKKPSRAIRASISKDQATIATLKKKIAGFVKLQEPHTKNLATKNTQLNSLKNTRDTAKGAVDELVGHIAEIRASIERAQKTLEGVDEKLGVANKKLGDAYASKTGPIPGNTIGGTTGQEICGNSSDDNNDGFADCADAQCSEFTGCKQGTGELCDDNQDNDGDSAVDCSDSECSEREICRHDEERQCQQMGKFWDIIKKICKGGPCDVVNNGCSGGYTVTKEPTQSIHTGIISWTCTSDEDGSNHVCTYDPNSSINKDKF